MTKKIAPYGTFLAQEIISHPGYKIVLIFMGQNGWSRCQSMQSFYPLTLCLPPRSSPSNFKWPVLGCELYLIDTGCSQDSFIKFCALNFFSSGALKVNYVSVNQSYVIEKEI